MFGPLGFPELIFILALALLIFGPKKLPQIGRTLGKGMSEFRKASNDLRRTINAEMVEQELRDADPRKVVRDSLRDFKQDLERDPDDAPAKDAPTDDAPAQGAPADDGGDEGDGGDPGAEGTVARGAHDDEPKP